MSDTRLWLHQAQEHVGTAQIVLDEVGRGLATVERVEVAAERAVPALRVVVLVALGCAVGTAVYLLVRRARRAEPRDGVPLEVVRIDAPTPGGPPGEGA